MIDGPVIQQAGKLALERGTTPDSILAELVHADVGVPIVMMTYYNLVFRAGSRRFARRLSESGVSGSDRRRPSARRGKRVVRRGR